MNLLKLQGGPSLWSCEPPLKTCTCKSSQQQQQKQQQQQQQAPSKQLGFGKKVWTYF